MAFSCGARSAFELKGKLLEKYVSRRQLQGLLGTSHQDRQLIMTWLHLLNAFKSYRIKTHCFSR